MKTTLPLSTLVSPLALAALTLLTATLAPAGPPPGAIPGAGLGQPAAARGGPAGGGAAVSAMLAQDAGRSARVA